ncbi:hypothetical protein Hypma_015137 [Hypsizygus marmoreus]|uniref:Uncharacterized protein n=1 Tax=Hypsizygus marmoreus TaxID=39966 RepID=A0A369K9W7_HYPMA|nr:hypothetical protein Hypma_015137 [Hypsizygus marmoreus]
MCAHIKPTSVASYLSGICQQLEPYFPEVHHIRKSSLVSRTLAGCQCLRAVLTTRKCALTIDDLDHVVHHYSSSTDHNDRLFVAQLLTSFFALMRLGELTYPDNPKLRDDRKVIKITSVTIADDQYKFFLPGHKADKFFEGNTIIIRRQDSLHDPFKNFSLYILSRQTRFPLSSKLWLTAAGRVPTRSFFITRGPHSKVLRFLRRRPVNARRRRHPSRRARRRPLHYSSYRPLGHRHFSNLYTKKPRSHSSPTFWTQLSILIYLIPILFTDTFRARYISYYAT